ncbi:MAG: type VII secretion protein EccE [Nocardiaceae bacterium]|nr:type VII secretion protein EccE [Nocardiaceae bacterium]
MQGIRRGALASVLLAELLGVAIGCLVATVASPVVAVTVGVLVGVVLVVPVRRQSLLGRLSTLIGYARSSNLDLPVPKDFNELGVSWSGLECAAVVSVVPKPRLTTLSRGGAAPGEQLPLADLAAALHQHDITLARIDIVSHSRRIQTRPANVLRQLIGPLPAVPDRAVWLVVRLDAGSAAVERRGGGRDGAVSTLRTATSRIVDVLTRHDVEARVMSADEITASSKAVAGGDVRNGWSSVTIGDHTDSGFSATELTPALVDQVWTVSAQATTAMLALRPQDVSGRVTASMSWRLTGADKTPPLPARRVDGHQLQHLRAHLPLASNGDGDLVFHDVSVAELSRFALATGGCGQLVGATSDGRAIAIPLCAPSTRVATLVGSSVFLRQTIFRGVATGARIVVRTDRTDMWESLVDAVGNRSHLRVIALSEPMPANYDVLVADGDLQPGTPGITTIFAASTPAALAGIEPDVSITATGPSITVTAGGQSIVVDLVTVPAEQDFIVGSSAVRTS